MVKELHYAIQNKCRRMLSKGVVFIHYNTRSYTVNVTKQLSELCLGRFGHPPLSPDLASSDFHLFQHLKSFLGGKHFKNDKEVKELVITWLTTQVATFYDGMRTTWKITAAMFKSSVTDGYSGSDIKLVSQETLMNAIRPLFSVLEECDSGTNLCKLKTKVISTDDVMHALTKTRPSASHLVSKYQKWQEDFGST